MYPQQSYYPSQTYSDPNYSGYQQAPPSIDPNSYISGGTSLTSSSYTDPYQGYQYNQQAYASQYSQYPGYNYPATANTGGYATPVAAPVSTYVHPAQFRNKKALLIGINYIGHQKGQLRGCINDVKNMYVFF
jgi:hypothetical protein